MNACTRTYSLIICIVFAFNNLCIYAIFGTPWAQRARFRKILSVRKILNIHDKDRGEARVERGANNEENK